LWVAKFPTSIKTADLVQPFRGNFEAFQAAMVAAGIAVRITATHRPKERAYLMHYSWMIVKGQIDPGDVPPLPELQGADIIWNHAHAKQGAQEMVDGYGIGGLGVPPALNSRHIEGRAVDTSLSWDGDIEIENKDGSSRHIVGSPRNSTHPDLIAAGATYGVIHLKNVMADKVHWSDDGH
jgi:hypothetical protein